MKKCLTVISVTTAPCANKPLWKPLILPFVETLDTIYYYKHINPEKIQEVLQAHSEGSSLRGISRTTRLAYNTVVSIVRAASNKAQLVHNAQVKQVETEEVSADEMWSFVQKKQKQYLNH